MVVLIAEVSSLKKKEKRREKYAINGRISRDSEGRYEK